MIAYQTKGYNRYGASMGRRNNDPADAPDELQIREVPIDNGGYDPGGAYWGTGAPLWHVTDGEEYDTYLRASLRDKAMAHFPDCSFTAPTSLTDDDIADMLTAYVEAAMFTSTDDDGEPLDDSTDLDLDTRAMMLAQCTSFARANEATILASQCTMPQLGHDFWMTRNGHGCGFWDGDWAEPFATSLTKASEAYGEVYLSVGDDGKVYGS